MEKDQLVIFKDRGLISVSGKDANDFLQNIITNDINKVNYEETVFSGLFNPQGKYLFEFFVIKSNQGYFLDCENEISKELISHLDKYKLRSKIEIKDLSSNYVMGIISNEKFKEIQKLENSSNQTLNYESNICFQDTRSKLLGTRILSSLEKLNLITKKLSLKVKDQKDYLKIAYDNGIPVKGLKNLQENLFGLEANFENFKAIDFEKGCYVGQENTARIKLKQKLRRKLLPISFEGDLTISSEIKFNEKIVGKILIPKPYPFALFKLFDPEINQFIDKELKSNNLKLKILQNNISN